MKQNPARPGAACIQSDIVARRWGDRTAKQIKGLVVHNAIALDDASMKELEAFGEPAFLLVPNGFHRQDAFIYVPRFSRWFMVSDRAAFQSHLEELASATNLRQILVGHGSTITGDAAGTLKSVAAELS